jgi:hypothetical protein
MTDRNVQELEERLARKVLLPNVFRMELDPGDGTVLIMRDTWSPWQPWRPWTSVEDAVECLEATGKTWDLFRTPGFGWAVQKSKAPGARSEAAAESQTLPRAICLALEAWLDAKEAAA